MKYCPQCNRRFDDAWITFCTDDGSLLRDELTPPADPNWDPRIRPTQYDDPSQRATQWVPHDTQRSGGWMPDRKSTRLNSSHLVISYAVFCLKKKKKTHNTEKSRQHVENK